MPVYGDPTRHATQLAGQGTHITVQEVQRSVNQTHKWSRQRGGGVERGMMHREPTRDAQEPVILAQGPGQEQ
eukprot:4214392-Prymnesium_polylepis.2